MSENNKDNSHSCLPDQHIIPQLESLLRTRLGNDVILVEYTATNYLPPGENYGSLILKVDAKIRDGKADGTRDLHLIAKIPPQSKRQRDFFDSPFTFSKERFMYEEILPTYKRYEEECGIINLPDIGPAFYGSRMSTLPGDVFDDDAVILMENLKTRNYYTGNRHEGLDFDHAASAVRAMARFHSLGIAMKANKLDFFEILKVRSKCLEMKNPEEWSEAMTMMYKNIQEDSVLCEHYDQCMKAFEVGSSSDCWVAPPDEPWSTIIHADFWINNIMFHRDHSTEKSIETKLVDYQNYLFLSPVRELAFFLGSGVHHETTCQDIDRLIDIYHEHLMERLAVLKVDATPYQRAAFDEELKRAAYIEFSHSAFMFKIMTKDDIDADDPEARDVANTMLKECSKMFFVRLRSLVRVYIAKGWLRS